MQVLVEPFKNGFRARTAAPWDIATEAGTEQEALEQLRSIVAERLQSGARVVHIELPESTETINPWREVAGILRDDPDFDAWQEAIHAYRRERDAEDEATG